MKKLFALVMALCCFMSCSVGVAGSRLNDYLQRKFEEMCIGGINFYATPDYIKGIYGEPSSEEVENKYYKEGRRPSPMVGYITEYVYNYNNQLEIHLWQKTEEDYYRVSKVICTAPNLTTPSGFKVGMHFSIVRNKYFTGKRHKNLKPMKNPNGELCYQMMANRGVMNFYVDNHDIIRKLEICYPW